MCGAPHDWRAENGLQRVRVTGTLVDREMHVGSLQRIAPTCMTQTAKAI